jgi:hypothetical protein
VPALGLFEQGPEHIVREGPGHSLGGAAPVELFIQNHPWFAFALPPRRLLIHAPRAQKRRYAETQAGPNGFRLRDWACAYADERDVEKCRLEAHAVAFDTLHHTVAPWLRRDGTTAWLQARSSVPFPSLPHPLADPAHKPASPARALHEAVKALYGADPHLLPAPPGTPPPDRASASVYLDEPQGQVLVVYAAADRLEFVSFSLA